MPDLDLDAIEARANAVTQGPWRWRETNRTAPVSNRWLRNARLGGGELQLRVLAADHVRVEDAAFLAHARTDVPALIAEVKRLRAENARLDEANDHCCR